jgi:Transposase zinc-binding domain
MTGHRLEVADVFRAHQDQFLQRWGHALSDQQRKVLRDIGLCRTAALGTHLERCDRCSYETVAYDSCLMGSLLLWGVRRGEGVQSLPRTPF